MRIYIWKPPLNWNQKHSCKILAVRSKKIRSIGRFGATNVSWSGGFFGFYYTAWETVSQGSICIGNCFQWKGGQRPAFSSESFGRLCGLWSIMRNKFRWQHKFYDALFILFLSLTNSNVSWHLVRNGDGEVHHRVQNWPSHIGVTIRRRRQEGQKQYLKKLRQRLATAIIDSIANTIYTFQAEALHT